MRRAGRVVERAPDGGLVVELSASACARCARGRGCGAALFTGAGGSPRFACGSSGGAGSGAARIGDRVELEIDVGDGRWLGAALLAYGLPTAGLLGGALVAEPWAPFTALAGLVGGILAWRGLAAGGRLAAVAGPCPASARIVSIEPQESR